MMNRCSSLKVVTGLRAGMWKALLFSVGLILWTCGLRPFFLRAGGLLSRSGSTVVVAIITLEGVTDVEGNKGVLVVTSPFKLFDALQSNSSYEIISCFDI